MIMELGLQELFTTIVLLILLLYYWSTSTYNYWNNLGIPGPRPTPLFGNSASYFLRQMSIPENLDDLYKKWKHVPFFGTYNARAPTLVITDPKLVNDILIKDFNVFPGRGLNIDENDHSLAGHLFHIEGHRWKILRSHIARAFTTGKLKKMFELMLECVDNFEKYLLNHIDNNNIVDCRDVAAKFTTDITGSCIFGLNMNALTNENSEFRRVGKNLFNLGIKNTIIRMICEISPALYRFIGMNRMPKWATLFFTNSIKETMEYRNKEKIVRHDLLDIFCDMKNKQDTIDFGKPIFFFFSIF